MPIPDCTHVLHCVDYFFCQIFASLEWNLDLLKVYGLSDIMVCMCVLLRNVYIKHKYFFFTYLYFVCIGVLLTCMSVWGWFWATVWRLRIKSRSSVSALGFWATLPALNFISLNAFLHLKKLHFKGTCWSKTGMRSMNLEHVNMPNSKETIKKPK